jgi:hypothetical protein
MFACSSSVARHAVLSRATLAIGTLMLAGGSTLAFAGDVYSSGDGSTGQWNPQGYPLKCQVHVDQYHALSAQIDASAAARQTETKNTLTKQRTQKKADFQVCVQGNRLLLQGSATRNAPQEGNVDDYGKRLPAMIGSTSYGGVELTVETRANRVVGEGISGPVTIASNPRKFARAEGYIRTSSEFRITKLWDFNNRQPVYSSVDGIPVSIYRK